MSFNKEVSCPNCRRDIDANEVHDERDNLRETVQPGLGPRLNDSISGQSQHLTTLHIQNRTKTRKNDFFDLLATDGRYYPSPRRNESARFVSQFLTRAKKPFKFNEVRTVFSVWCFKGCTSKLFWDAFPKQQRASAYLLDIEQLEKVEKKYLHRELNRCSILSVLDTSTMFSDRKSKKGDTRIMT